MTDQASMHPCFWPTTISRVKAIPQSLDRAARRAAFLRVRARSARRMGIPDSRGRRARRLAHRFQGAESLGDVQVGDEVRLFILFDRAAALGPVVVSEIRPRSRWGSGVCGLGRAGGYRACKRTRHFAVSARARRRSPGASAAPAVGQVALLDQKGVIWRVVPDRGQEIRTARAARAARWAASTAAITWCSEIFSPVRLE